MLKPIVFSIAIMAATPAISCGNPLLWAMLFARVPEAKPVFDADLAARTAGTLQARVYETDNPGLDYHRWSIAWLKNAAGVLNVSVQSELSDGETLTVLLVDEVAALQFAEGADPKVVSAAGLNFAEGFDAITTINALESGLNYGLSAPQMIEQGVLVPTGAGRQQVIARLF